MNYPAIPGSHPYKVFCNESYIGSFMTTHLATQFIEKRKARYPQNNYFIA